MFSHFDLAIVDTLVNSSIVVLCNHNSYFSISMSSNDSSIPPPQGPVTSSGDDDATAGMKRVNSEQPQLTEKKLRRLEKNRLSARECRRRKREATENLEREINVLEGENLRLRLQLQVRPDRYEYYTSDERVELCLESPRGWCFHHRLDKIF
jgi:hypothetical protein